MIPAEYAALVHHPAAPWVLFAVVVLAAFLLGVFMTRRRYARPLRKLAASIAAFLETGAWQPASPGRHEPREVRALETAFADMAARFSVSRTRDEEVSHVKNDFVSTAAHQLRTPLTGIRWSLEALQNGPLPPAQKAIVDDAVEKGKGLMSIVNTLIEASSIGSAKYAYHFEKTDLAKLAEKGARDVALAASMRKISVYFTPPQTAAPAVRADKERVAWVISTLLENAVRYTPENGSVRISIESAAGRAFLKVRDTGIGIKAEDRANIFERFYRAGNAIATVPDGSGMALYLSRAIARDHGGDLNFTANDDGPGTTFTLALPLA